jgi:hypothetical protein
MKEDILNSKLSRSNFFLVRYAFLINVAMFLFIIFLLFLLKIENSPILYQLVKYYLK